MERQTISLLTSLVAKLTEDILALKDANNDLQKQNKKLIDDQKLMDYLISRNDELTRQLLRVQEKQMTITDNKEPLDEYETFTNDNSFQKLPAPDIESTRLANCSADSTEKRSSGDSEYEPCCYDCNETDCWGCVFSSGEISTQSPNDVNYPAAVLDFFDYSSNQSIADSDL